MTSHTNGAASAPNTLPDATLANPKLAVPAAVADAPAPPLIVVKSPSDAPDAGLRSLDHSWRIDKSPKYLARTQASKP
ncbi:hypothetical protein COL516b_008368 [Colletotrichum fioriniae]|nr:uncharacterized protein COL516b_008368 [Colletotrichum fioriniae]KAJ0300438.1 hypothetical protein COL516b_008368 [Colletotrichum fioriniae]